MRHFTEFQIFAKPASSNCNLRCEYCYYLDKNSHMPMDLAILETYITQHIEANLDDTLFFSWHGGEPTVLGLDYFQTIVDIQKKHLPDGCTIINGMQTNGTLLNEDWCRFMSENGFVVGLSLDGPEEIHNRFRKTGKGHSTFDRAMTGWTLLQAYQIPSEILCVVNSANVQHPDLIYSFFKEISGQFFTFLPLVERMPGSESGVSARTVPAKIFGDFLITIFDIWKSEDIGHIKIQIFEEALRTAFNQDHTLCIFKETCGGVPVIESNGDFYSCDHYVDKDHRLGNIMDTHLLNLLESDTQRLFGQDKKDCLTQKCRTCDVLNMCNGGCPKNRFVNSPDGQPDLNYLCDGYKKFFTHCQPFVNLVARHWKHQSDTAKRNTPVSRNDPCPCGSGRKYKRCCL